MQAQPLEAFSRYRLLFTANERLMFQLVQASCCTCMQPCRQREREIIIRSFWLKEGGGEHDLAFPKP